MTNEKAFTIYKEIPNDRDKLKTEFQKIMIEERKLDFQSLMNRETEVRMWLKEAVVNGDGVGSLYSFVDDMKELLETQEVQKHLPDIRDKLDNLIKQYEDLLHHVERMVENDERK